MRSDKAVAKSRVVAKTDVANSIWRSCLRERPSEPFTPRGLNGNGRSTSSSLRTRPASRDVVI